jgi:predicted RNA-binding protein with PIN domain
MSSKDSLKNARNKLVLSMAVYQNMKKKKILKLHKLFDNYNC